MVGFPYVEAGVYSVSLPGRSGNRPVVRGVLFAESAWGDSHLSEWG